MPTFTVASSFGTLREFNPCHAPDSGRFCSDPGSLALQARDQARRMAARTARLERERAANPPAVAAALDPYRATLPGLRATTVRTVETPTPAEIHALHFDHGKVELVRDQGEPAHLMVMILDVHTTAQRKGYGTALLQAAHAYAKALGYKGLYSFPDDRTTAGQRAWAKVPTTRRKRSQVRLDYGPGDVEFWERRVSDR